MGRIVINPDLCKGCGFCIKYCPKTVIKIGTEFNQQGYKFAVPADEKSCIACGTCALMCPDAAINVYK